MAETRRRFDPEFRAGVVRIVRKAGKSIGQVTRDLGVTSGTLANWVQQDREARSEAAAGQLAEDERAELARLRRENAELAMERDSPQAIHGPAGQESDGPVSVAAFIASQRTEHDVPHAVDCQALGVSESWFYRWRDRPRTPRQDRRTRLTDAVRHTPCGRRGCRTTRSRR
ncbi:transposase [Dactylosporangium sp. NPDC051485]|uniref:transposase n=1 Tax=Dactylosporangium sp. NPDC051485 TaxID=3154846 RepID=UPI0034193BC6